MDLRQLEYLVYAMTDDILAEIRKNIPSDTRIDMPKIRLMGRKLVHDIAVENLKQRKELLSEEQRKSTTTVGDMLQLEHERNEIHNYLRHGISLRPKLIEDIKREQNNANT